MASNRSSLAFVPSIPPPSAKFSFRSPSPSRSPARNVAPAYDLDPLLRCLSPEATLQALSSADAVPNNEKSAHDILSRSISQVSPEERALGIRAAVTAKNLTLWYKEVQSWEWPKRSDAHLGKAFIPPSSAAPEEEYYGSLPSVVVEQHETRIEEIRDGMDSLGVDDLKEHVLNAHIPSRSRPSSSNSTMSVPPPLSYVQLSDFTAVVTATILRVLPILSRLNTLLSTWDVRLLVLRQIPGLLRCLQVTRAASDDAFLALKSRDPPTEKDSLYSRSNFYAKQAELGAAVASTGRRMDHALDALEGREDSLPENWIDDLETIESDFGTWVVEAEKRSAENEWMRSNAMTNTSPDQPGRSSDEIPIVSEQLDNESESRRNGLPHPMETIHEEPVSKLKSETHSPIDPVQVPGPPVVSDAPISPTETSLPETPVEESEEPALPQTKELSPDSQQETAPTEILKPTPPSSESENDSEQGPSPARAQSLEQSSPSSSAVSPKTVPQRASPDTASIANRPTQISFDVTEPVDNPSHAGDPLSKVTSNSDPGSGDAGHELRPVTSAEDESVLESVVAQPASVSAIQENSSHSTESLSGPSKPFLSSDNEQPLKDEESPPPKPLESPIKLSKTRQGPENDKSHRRTSNASIDSLSDYPSLVSSPEVQEPRPGSSNGTPLFVDTPPQFPRDYPLPGLAPSNTDHTLREDRLRRFDSQKGSPRMGLKHNRAVSLPLQRFINERLGMNCGGEAAVDADSPSAGRRPSVASHPEQEMETVSNKDRSSTPTNNIRRLASQRLETSYEAKPSRPKAGGSRLSEPWEHNKRAPLKNSAQRALNSQPPTYLATTRLSKELKTHPSRDSLGSSERNQSKPPSRASTPADLVARKNGSRSSTPSRMSRKKDPLDEKISTILGTLPTRIHLLSGAHEDSDASSVTSSLPLKTQEKLGSGSPQGTGAPSLTLTPAISRRRQSYAHGPEESSVKLYHLHRGGKTNPTKLFVRSVGENGERVMVRVGGGWADLAEYLREYAIHHGRRHVSDTPRVEVQGVSSRDSSAYTSPGSKMLTPTPNNGRSTPSVISNRPSSSLAVRKTRRASNVSEATDFRTVSAGEVTNRSHSPISSISPRRRLSVSSNNSAGATSIASEAHHGSSHSPATTIAAGSTRSTPLGLAGPKPRPRHVSMSPESEAWVEDVLGQARRNSSLRPVAFGIPGDREASDGAQVPTLSKVRSVNDMGSAGTSKRVALRGLTSGRRSSKQS